MKQEDVSYPNHTQIEAGTTIDPMYHGFQGRVAGWFTGFTEGVG
jgi:hypothetical protein